MRESTSPDKLNKKIFVRMKDETRSFVLGAGENLMDGLLREGFYVSALCGRNGRCGKCKVRVLSGTASVSSADRKFFTDRQLEEGWRLSCTLVPDEDLCIYLEASDEAEMEVISSFREESKRTVGVQKTELAVAIDIGTTTIAFQLLDAEGNVQETETCLNSQRRFGADVVARIQAATDGNAGLLRESIREDLQRGIVTLVRRTGGDLSQIKTIVIACNTTMSHLLLGYDCAGLGVYPYTPVNISTIRGVAEEMLGIPSKAEVVVIPGISTYVGGDIVSGLYACDFEQVEKVSLLVDLGTNGEMALGNRKKLLVTSTAAGPAFEGGNLTWGTGSVAGAICSVGIRGNTDNADTRQEETGIRLQSGYIVYTGTVRNQSPMGICGTGAVESIAELLRVGLLDETGLLDEEYFEEGFPLAENADRETIVLTQKDIRELQLAKSAVRAGIETLLLRYGVTKEQVDRVYLAGGFGYRLDVEKAIAIGMLPEEFAGKVEAVGNSSLAGVVKFLRETEAEKKLQELVEISEEIGLAEDGDFNEFYMEYMMFE